MQNRKQILSRKYKQMFLEWRLDKPIAGVSSLAHWKLFANLNSFGHWKEGIECQIPFVLETMYEAQKRTKIAFNLLPL